MSTATEQVVHQIIARLRIYLSRHPRGHLTIPPRAYTPAAQVRLVPVIGYVASTTYAMLPDDDIPKPPDFAVEVRTVEDDLLQLRRLCMTYIDVGTSVVWLVDMPSHSVELFANQASGGTIMATASRRATLNGGTLLPGFQMRVEDIFATK